MLDLTVTVVLLNAQVFSWTDITAAAANAGELGRVCLRQDTTFSCQKSLRFSHVDELEGLECSVFCFLCQKKKKTERIGKCNLFRTASKIAQEVCFTKNL